MPQVRKAAAERLRELEHPAIDMLATILGAKDGARPTNKAAQRLKVTLQAPTILGAIKTVFERLDRVDPDGEGDDQDELIDLSKLSTPLLRKMRDELRAHEQRESQAVAAIAPWNSGTRGTRD